LDGGVNMSVTINGSDGITTPSLEVDSTTLVVDEVNNRVGVGTSSPNSSLDIQASSGEGLRLSNGGTEYATFQGNTTTGEVRIGGTYPNFYPTFYSGNSEAMLIDPNANLKFNSGYGSVATAYGVRAWVNFNGTGGVSILNSGNVSSIADNGTGKYTVNFATAFTDDTYSALVSVAKSDPNDDGNQKATLGNTTRIRSTTTLPVTTVVNTSTLVDTFLVCVAVIR